MARTAPLPTAPGVPLPPWLSRAKLGGGRRGWGGGGNTHKHPPSTLYPHPRVPGRRSNYPRSYSRGVREASRTRTPAPGQVQSGPCLRHRQLIGARRHRPSPWQRQGPVDADGGCYGNPGPMGTPANEIEAGVGGGGRRETVTALRSSPCPGWAGPPWLCPPPGPPLGTLGCFYGHPRQDGADFYCHLFVFRV